MAIYYLVAISRHKAFGILALVGIVGAVLILAPTSYLDRMQSVGHIEQDNSSRARLQAWGAATRMALDYPLGVGANNFPSAYGRYYIPSDDENAISWRSRRWISAHSIYFRMLAEYGVLGLGLLLWLILTNFRDNVAARKRIAAGSEAAPIQAIWPGLVTTAVVGHAVSGAFLAGLTYPHLFLLCGLTIGCKRFAESIVDPPPPGKSSSQQRTEPSRYASYPR
jgi:O-antigen ligase